MILVILYPKCLVITHLPHSIVGGRIISMRKQTHKANILSPGRSTLKFPLNYILSTILNESPNDFRPVIVCWCSGKDAIT